MTEPTAFPECHWDEVRRRMASDGPAAATRFIEGFADARQRLQLFSLAQQRFGHADAWARRERHFDAYAIVVRPGIAEALRQAGAESDAAVATRKRDFANVLSYNLSADLAECWPGDTTRRERRHFEAGLAAAEDCLRWRTELGKGPGPFSMAWWAKGAHLPSLGRAAEAAAAFPAALDHAVKGAGGAAAVAPGADFSVVLDSGYLGLDRALLRENLKRTRWERLRKHQRMLSFVARWRGRARHRAAAPKTPAR